MTLLTIYLSATVGFLLGVGVMCLLQGNSIPISQCEECARRIEIFLHGRQHAAVGR